jgi:hypothetical protein
MDFNGVSPALTFIGFICTILMVLGAIALLGLILIALTAFLFDFLPWLFERKRG